MTPGFDWPALLQAGLQTLRLKPAEFWALTPAELALMLGFDATLRPMARAEFLALAARYPDDPRSAP